MAVLESVALRILLPLLIGVMAKLLAKLLMDRFGSERSITASRTATS